MADVMSLPVFLKSWKPHLVFEISLFFLNKPDPGVNSLYLKINQLQRWRLLKIIHRLSWWTVPLNNFKSTKQTHENSKPKLFSLSKTTTFARLCPNYCLITRLFRAPEILTNFNHFLKSTSSSTHGETGWICSYLNSSFLRFWMRFSYIRKVWFPLN